MTESLTSHSHIAPAEPSFTITPPADISAAPVQAELTTSPTAPITATQAKPTSPIQAEPTVPPTAPPRTSRTAFAARVDEASDALGLDATDEEKERLGHWIVAAWEDKLACADCDKDDDATLACAMRTLIRENGTIRTAAVRCERYYRVQAARRTAKLFGASHLGEHFKHRTFAAFEVDDDTLDAFEACRTFADTFTAGRRGLLLAGGCGCGKTHLAASIVHALIDRGHHAILMTSARILDALKTAFGDTDRTRAIRTELTTADLLVIDDIGAEHLTDWARSELAALINDRYESSKTTILTTNLTLSALTARLGRRTVSRIAEMTDGIRITAGDRRLRRHTERSTP